MNKLTCAIFLFSMLTVSHSASAELPLKLQDLCSKMKSCSLTELDKQNAPPEIKQQMESSFDQLCANWIKPYSLALDQAGLDEEANACVDSIVNESCASLMQAEGQFTTEECNAFETAAKEAGVDLEELSQ